MLPPVFLNRECFNTQPPEGGWDEDFIRAASMLAEVSTHSRPKAAGTGFWGKFADQEVSTHSRPKTAGFAFSLQEYE